MASSLGQDQIKALIAQTKAKLAQDLQQRKTTPVAPPPRPPMNASGLATPLPSGMMTPLPSGMMTPLPSGMMTPLPSGMLTPLPSGMMTPLPGMGFQNQFGGNLGMLQARVQAQLAALKASGSLPGLNAHGAGAGGFHMPMTAGQSMAQRKAIALKLDAQGRVVDASGKVVQLEQRVSEFAVNARAKRQEKLNLVTQQVLGDEDAMANSQFFDERIEEKPSNKRRRGLQFHEAGHFIDRADRQRAMEKLEKLQSEIATAAKKTGISTAAKLALTIPKREELESHEVPDMEWWDSVVLGDATYDAFEDQNAPLQDITSLIQHPVTLDVPGPKAETVLPTYLTKKEQKKIRRQRRRAAEEEKQEKIRLGLEDAPAPKVKISNLMRVLGTEAVQDPTKVEAVVRAQMQLRQRQHDQQNATHQLSDAERKAKRAKKLQDTTVQGVAACVFSISSLKSPKIKFKVETNAQQYNLTGCAVMTDQHNIVVVEGGPKNIRKYKRLMLHRIQWNETQLEGEEQSADREADATAGENSCCLVWEGSVERRFFKGFTVKLLRSEQLAREWMDKRRSAHYWDLALTHKLAEDS